MKFIKNLFRKGKASTCREGCACEHGACRCERCECDAGFCKSVAGNAACCG